MSDPSSSSSPTPAHAALAAAVAPLFAGLPKRERSTYDRTSHRYVEPLAAADVAATLVLLFARAYVQHLEGEYEDRRLIARVRPADGTAEHVTRDRFAEAVATVLRHMPDAPATASHQTRRAVAHVRLLAERGPSSPYVRRVASAIGDRLPYLGDLAPRPTLVRAGTASATVSPKARAEQRRAYMRDRNRSARAADREGRREAMMRAAAWCTAWREQVGPGAHAAPELHRAYVAAAERSGMTPLGRTQLYRIADEALGPRSRRAVGPVYVVPQEVSPMTREERRDLAALIVDRLTAEWREHALDGLADLVAERRTEQAAPDVDNVAPVVDLAARRALRRVA
ncbi:hypothetical protein F8280_26795 [Micromonospora noduli]|uniref:hypothetical protein n=1 Tax=Micromonospora noduli TaxID=709876 RepID=UPI00124B6A53|nr:hypothetical protein [Micromonospora noduli]KAB1919093.1 hypothetical protein F8280_26795 [Micromonospora noduli]